MHITNDVLTWGNQNGNLKMVPVVQTDPNSFQLSGRQLNKQTWNQIILVLYEFRSVAYTYTLLANQETLLGDLAISDILHW